MAADKSTQIETTYSSQGAAYRPPSATVAIDTTLELNIEAAYLRCIYLHGEFNINYLDTATYQNQELKFKSSHQFSNVHEQRVPHA